MARRLNHVDVESWDDPVVASWWQQEFTHGADPEYTEQILPLIEAGLVGYGRVLDVGTGEGQAARRLAARGHEVVGLDPVRAQITEAARRSGSEYTVPYALAAADALPFSTGSFDAAVACLVFEHIDALDEAISEVARILRTGGRFLFLLNHPLLQTPGSGWIDDRIIVPPEQYWRIGPYLPEAVTVEEVQKDVLIRFVHRPLSRYVNTLSDVGLVLERMVEPAPPPGFIARAPRYEQADTIPRLLALYCRRVGRQGLDQVEPGTVTPTDGSI